MSNFKVGDKVIIKSWEEMEKEFGLNGGGDINCSGFFVKQMAYLCGKVATITEIDDCSSIILLDIDTDGWAISTDMIKKVEVGIKETPIKASVELAFEKLDDDEKRELLRKIYVGSVLEKFVNQYLSPSQSLLITQGNITLVEEQLLIETEILD